MMFHIKIDKIGNFKEATIFKSDNTIYALGLLTEYECLELANHLKKVIFQLTEEKKKTKLLLYKGNSRWTSAGRNHAVHIAGENREPICGKLYKNGALDIWEGEEKEVTCHNCKIKSQEAK